MPDSKAKSLKPTVYIPIALQKWLATIHDYPLIFVQAASGFGKTTVVSEYLRQLDINEIYWYTCMGEPLRKAWNGICKTFAHIDKSVAKQLETLEYPMQENLVDIANIMSECNIDKDIWFIIDNFQYIQSELPKRILHAFSYHNCPRLHIVIITQTIEPMDIGGILANQTALIQNNDFFFSKEDTYAYFRANGIALSADELNELQMLSEGWVAALNLQLIQYLREENFEVTDSMDNLIRAVIWKNLEPEEQNFLIAVSLLECFTMKQAYILLGKDTLPLGITRLLDGGSFIHYERDSGIYTLHGLLKSFLKKEFRNLPIDTIRKMQKLAADAYASVGERYYALCNYLEVGEWEALLSLPLKVSDFSLYPKDNTAEILERVLKKCDKEFFVRYPQTLSTITFELFRADRYAAFKKGCLLIEKIIYRLKENGLNKEKIQILTGQLALLQSFDAFNDIERMSVLHRRAWQALDGSFSNRADWNDSWTFGQPSVLYLFWSVSGSLNRELDCMDECLPYYIRLTEGHGTGANSAMRAETLLMRGEDTAAEALCHKAIYLASTKEQDSICFSAEMTLLRIALLRGDATSFEKMKKNILKRAKIGTEPSVKRMADLVLTFVCVPIEKNNIPEWLMDLDWITENLYNVAIPFGALTYLRWLLSKGHYTKLLGIAQGVLPLAENNHFLLPQVYFHILIAIAYYQLGQKKEAGVALDYALSIALVDGIYLPFAEYGEEIKPLLKLKEKQSGVNKLLNLCRRQRLGTEKIRKATRYSRLTPREREVAYFAAGGLTNRDIASRVFISQETVKTTMKNIFQKLGIRSRVQLRELKDMGKI